MKICPRLLIFELSDCTLRILGGMILAFLKYCYVRIDILGVFDWASPPPPVCLVMECPPGDKSKLACLLRYHFQFHLYNRPTLSSEMYDF